MRVLKLLAASRKVWVGALTIILTALVAKYLAPWLGLDAEQVGIIATAIIGTGLAIIVAIAYEDGQAKSAGNGAVAPLILAILLMPLLAGCVAPAAVREAQDVEEAALMGYVRNTGRIHDLTLGIYQVEREKAIEYTTAKVLEKVHAAADAQGNLPVAEFEGALTALVQEREDAAAGTQAVVKRVRDLIATNDRELAKTLRLHGAMRDWLEAGIDDGLFGGLLSEVWALASPPAAAISATLPAP